MSRIDALPDTTLVSIFTEARSKLGLTAALRFVISENERARVANIPQSVWHVVDEVAARWKATRDDIIGRDRRYSEPRVICWWVLHCKFGMSFPELGRVFDGRHHTSVLAPVNAMQVRIKTDDILRALVTLVEEVVWRQLGKKAA